jgi:hypothetical protein
MKRWVIYRAKKSGRFENERLFDGESVKQVEVGMLVYDRKPASYVEISKDDGGDKVQAIEGELYDVIEVDDDEGRGTREVLKLVSRLNRVIDVMES